jgi:hypothetical protein
MTLSDSTFVQCPYCGESNEIELETSIQKQEYVEDCQVCCQPMLVQIIVDETSNAIVSVRKENE